jgi:hypothetical protein
MERSLTVPPASERRPSRRSASNEFAFWLDAVLFVLFVLLRTPRLTGLSWHEWLGLAFLLPMLVHLLLSWRWIVTALKRMFAPPRRRDSVNLLLNVALFVTTVGVIVSGVLISRVALPQLGIGTIDDRVWRETHNDWTDAMLICVGAHIAMNFRWIVKAADPYLPQWLKEGL